MISIANVTQINLWTCFLKRAIICIHSKPQTNTWFMKNNHSFLLKPNMVVYFVPTPQGSKSFPSNFFLTILYLWLQTKMMNHFRWRGKKSPQGIGLQFSLWRLAGHSLIYGFPGNQQLLMYCKHLYILCFVFKTSHSSRTFDTKF